VLERYRIDTGRPYVFFYGRVTRQKGIGHLLSAFRQVEQGVQLVLRAGAADTPELGREIEEGVHRLDEERGGVVWIRDTVERHGLAQLLTNASVVCVPSVYEPSGMVNMEAMACEVPVVASAVGGIPEIVDDGVTGLLVPFEPRSASDSEPADPVAYARDLAAALNRVLGDAQLQRRLGAAGRRRVVAEFSWAAVGKRTVELYASLAG